jgi:TolB-like protein/Flp pilus assembly protein TadD
LEELFEQALSLRGEQREAFLETCSDDHTIRAELASLLAAAEQADPFFDSLARAVISDEAPAGDESASDPLIGRSLRQYRIEEKVGGGGMGVVYRAHDTRLNRPVALKFLPRHMTGDMAATQRFQIEAQAAAALDHPNVCSIHEIGEDEEGGVFIAMAYYEGETLQEKIERGPLPIEEAWDYARQIAAGLAAAHARDVIHRDIKPGNVIVTPDGVAKVLDFGLAKLADVTLTVSGTTLGTVAYMSPEQLAGRVVDHRTDLWSLGVVLYEMLTGERPFRGDRSQVVIHAILHEEPASLPASHSEVSLELEALVSGLLVKDPDRREVSAEELTESTGPRELAVTRPVRKWRRLIQEIHRRSLWQVLGIYAVGSWFALQVVDTIVGALKLPDWAPPIALILLIIGLPIVLATAVIQKGSRPTLAKTAGEATEPGSRAAGPPHHLFTWRNAILGGAAAFALWGVVAAGWLVLRGTPPGTSRERLPSVAALPFADLSGNPEDIYFTDGIHDEILARLAKIAGLRVISRTSVLGYRDTPKNVRDVAEELGVGHVLEGSVRKTGNRIRVTAQLIDAERDQHVWAEQYDRELTAENLFVIQGDVAQKIAAALRTELSPEETERIRARPTENLQAYEYYLRGNESRNRSWDRPDVEQSIQMWERAVVLDPGFAVAYAALSQAHTFMWWMYYDRTPQRLQRAKQALDRALELEPDLPEGLTALGWYHYWGHLDYARALEAFAAAEEAQPNDPDISNGIGSVLRRQGDMEAALVRFQRWQELDPRSAMAAYSIAQTYGHLRRLDAARLWRDKAIALAPEWGVAYVAKAGDYVASGQTEQAREVLNLAGERGVLTPQDAFWVVWLDAVEGKYEVALERLREAPDAFEGQSRYVPRVEWQAVLHGLLGDRERARANWDSSRVQLEERVAEHPEDPRFRSALGIAYAGLGRGEEAIREGTLGVVLMPPSREATRGVKRVEDLARIYVTVGELDAAVQEIETLLNRPGRFTQHTLRLEPWWRPLHGHPRFEALLSNEDLSTE